MRPPYAPNGSRWGRILQGVRNRHLLVADLLLLPLAVVLAFALRLDNVQLQPYVRTMLIYALAAPLVKLPIFSVLGLYGRFWQYASTDEALTLVWAALIGGLTQGALFLGVQALFPTALVPGVPRSVPLIDILLVLVSIAGPRFALRMGAQSARRLVKFEDQPAALQQVLIAGAGEAGAMVLRELRANPQTGLAPIGFVDDDPNKQGMLIHRTRVLGGRSAIPDLVRERRVDQVIIAMPGAPGKVVRETVGICKAAGVHVRIIPGMYELLGGRVSINQLRDVQIEDLLRREPVHTDTAQVGALLRDRRVLVTGAGGSIGSELCRQIARCAPAELILLGHGENSIFEIYNELSKGAGERGSKGIGETEHVSRITHHAVIADVRDTDRIRAVFEQYQPEIVFHAAAHKHVPLMEANIADAVSNNGLGTLRVVEASMAVGVGHFVLISTDKAVNPTSIMGATKRVAELIVEAAARQTGACFVAVRFGNVLGSLGSVVPFFQRHIAAGWPVTVTHPDMRRYFMTIPESVQLVLQAAALGQGGEVFVFDMGEPVRIMDLAQDLIRLSGLEPGQDIDIEFTGSRPGEKLFEELFLAGETYERTAHAKIFAYRNDGMATGAPNGAYNGWAELVTRLNALTAVAATADRARTSKLLQALVPEYKPR